MDDLSRLNLSKLLSDKDLEQTTEKIRSLRHSPRIKADVDTMIALKRQYSRLSRERVKDMATTRCSFLFNNYTNIFNRLAKDELDTEILYKFIETLRRVEEGNLDQHQASYEAGLVLKRLYVDSSARQNSKRDEESGPTHREPVHKMSWAVFKAMTMSDVE